eukprot:6165130-Pleurochrysis_carterae.AAC.2
MAMLDQREAVVLHSTTASTKHSSHVELVQPKVAPAVHPAIGDCSVQASGRGPASCLACISSDATRQMMCDASRFAMLVPVGTLAASLCVLLSASFVVHAVRVCVCFSAPRAGSVPRSLGWMMRWSVDAEAPTRRWAGRRDGLALSRGADAMMMGRRLPRRTELCAGVACRISGVSRASQLAG